MTLEDDCTPITLDNIARAFSVDPIEPANQLPTMLPRQYFPIVLYPTTNIVVSKIRHTFPLTTKHNLLLDTSYNI